MKTKLLFIIVICLTGTCYLSGQGVSATRDKYTLLTMPYVSRPLNLYKGQIQANAGYKFAMRSRSYDKNGEVIDLKENGNPSVAHYYFLELRYGVLDFIELGAETSYRSQGIREESTTYVAYITDLLDYSYITVTNLKEYRGLGDLYVYGAVRLPVDFKTFDFRISGGMFLPVASHEQAKPSHTVTDYYNDLYYTINYHHNYRNGYGVPLWQASATVKLAFSKFSAEASFSFRDPLKEGKNFRWDETLTGQTFIYTKESYSYLPDRMISINGSVHYQAAGWFNLFLSSGYLRYSDGWTEYYGFKYRNPKTSLMTLEPGYEIVVSPSLRLSQTVGFAIAGTTSDAPFYMITTLGYNIFPFLK